MHENTSSPTNQIGREYSQRVTHTHTLIRDTTISYFWEHITVLFIININSNSIRSRLLHIAPAFAQSVKRASAGVIRNVNPRPEKYQPLPFAYIPYIFHTLTHAQNT